MACFNYLPLIIVWIFFFNQSNAWLPRVKPKIGLNKWSELDNEEHGIWRTDFENITQGQLKLLDNGQTYVVSPLITGLAIDCNASYPIKWVAHFADEVTELHSYLLKVRNFRRNPDVFNPRSNLFTAQLNFYGELNIVSGNYSCVSVEYPNEVIKNIYVFWQGSSPSNLILSGQTVEVRSEDGMTAVLPCRVSRPDLAVQLYKKVNSEFVPIVSPYIKFDPKRGFTVNLYQYNGAFGQYKCLTDEDDDPLFINLRKGMLAKFEFNDTMIGNASLFFNKVTQELTCCSNSSKTPKINAMFCFDSFACDMISTRSHFQKFANTGKRFRNGTCSSERIYHKDSGVVRCMGDGIDVFRNFFTDVPTQANNHTPDLYFRWDTMKPERTIDISITSRRPVYQGQNITVSCDTAFYYFADGMRWAVRWKNGSLRFIQNPTSNLIGYDQAETSFQSIRLRINKNMSEILCFAPVWNTTDWINKTFILDVHDARPPVFQNPEVEVKQLVLNSTEQHLECRVNGTPTPTVRWKKNNRPLIHESNLALKRQNGSTFTLTILRVSHSTQGEYECVATNIGGTIEKQYMIYVEEPSSSLGAAGMTILILMIMCLVGGMGFLIWKMQLQKKIIDHLAGIVFRDVGANDVSNNTNNVVNTAGNSDQNPFPSSQS